MQPLPRPDWAEIHHWLRENFPDVRHLSVDEVAAWRADAGRTPPLLLDIRSGVEQAVSWIPGARCARSEAQALAEIPELPKDTPIVTYCAVGVRSARLAHILRNAGFSSVANLEGGIFAWANRGLPLENAAGPETAAHPYDEHWGVLLESAKRSTIASE